MDLEGLVKEIRDGLYPNQVYTHPRTEIVSDTRWKLVATLSANCALWHCHIEHTRNGDGVLIAFKEDPEDKDIIGPFTGDNPRYPIGGDFLQPITHFKRRTRPRHIYAKLRDGWFVPSEGEAGEADREDGPIVQIEEWLFVDKEGQTDEHRPLEVDRSHTSYISEIEKQQKKEIEEIEREGE